MVPFGDQGSFLSIFTESGIHLKFFQLVGPTLVTVLSVASRKSGDFYNIYIYIYIYIYMCVCLLCLI